MQVILIAVCISFGAVARACKIVSVPDCGSRTESRNMKAVQAFSDDIE